MNSRLSSAAAALTLLLGITLVGAIGVAAEDIRLAVADIAQTAQINDGAAEIARGPARVAPIDSPAAPAAAAIVTE